MIGKEKAERDMGMKRGMNVQRKKIMGEIRGRETGMGVDRHVEGGGFISECLYSHNSVPLCLS